MIYKKKKIGSYNLHMIKTDRFKTINIEMIFRNKIRKEDITITNFLSSILTYSTKRYPTKNSFSIKLQELYAVKLFPSCYRIGNFYNVDFNIRMLDEKYSEANMLEETLDILSEMIGNPNVTDEKFDSTSFQVVKNAEIAQIERFKENARKYSIVRMLQTLDENEPFSYNTYGYMEDLNNITPENLYQFYQKFIRNSVIDIFIVGDIDFSKTEKLITEKFKFRVFKNNTDSPILEIRKPRKKPQIVFENDNTSQAKLSIGCTVGQTSKYEREYVFNIYNIILGATPESKFFKNIREKYSMCYYVSAIGNKLDNLLIITSGITKDNFDKMILLIKKEMKDMEKGNFTEEDIENAKKYYLSILEEIDDRPSQIISTYYAMDLLNTEDIESRKQKIQKVTKKDIIKLANKIKIDTIFLLGGDKK